jgi:hypothetical protein
MNSVLVIHPFGYFKEKLCPKTNQPREKQRKSAKERRKKTEGKKEKTKPNQTLCRSLSCDLLNEEGTSSVTGDGPEDELF